MIEFTKEDLKDGMIVTLRDGDKMVKMGDNLVNNTSYCKIEEFKNDLTSYEDLDDCDVMAVYKTTSPITLSDIFKEDYLELVWERKETKKMTAEEMRKMIEELTGDKIELVKNRRGRWILFDECSNAGVYCSVCNKKVFRKDYANQKMRSKYCPNCGAIMDI